MPDPLPAHAVGPDRAAWVQRVRDMLGRPHDGDDWAFIAGLYCRLQIKGMRAVLTPEERERVARIERGVSNA